MDSVYDKMYYLYKDYFNEPSVNSTSQSYWEEVWYIGDQYQCDIVGAGAAGLFPVWYVGAIDMKYEPKEDILTIEHWKELIDLLKELDQKQEK